MVVSASDIGFEGTVSLEEMILTNDVVARGRMLRFTTSTTSLPQGPAGPDQTTAWYPVLAFRFRIHDYLKGSGQTEITVDVMGGSFGTEAEAQAALPHMVSAHDTQWDDRQAILFLQPASGSGRYHLGSDDRYQVSSVFYKAWLPEAQTSTGLSRGAEGKSTTSSDPLFLLDSPGPRPSGNTARAASATTSTEADTAPTIRLSDLKTRISALEAEANAGGTDAYRECVELAYDYERSLRNLQSAGTLLSVGYYGPIASGQPETVVFEARRLAGTQEISEANLGRHWFSGSDPDIVKFKAVDFRPDPYNPDTYVYTKRVATARPLPGGSYQFFPNDYLPFQLVCNKFTPLELNRHDARLTVTAHPRAIHEAFFDPVAIGSAVGANGVLEPTDFMLNGTNTTISSLKWEDGAVSMTLNPTASLADYAIDFIDTTGTTTLSLTSDNASTTALTWTVPDKPWSDGDLLMLRIHKPISNDATLSGLALSGIDLTFSTATTTYTASVPATTTQTTVTPTANHASATYVVKLGGVVDDDGTIPLAAGANVITIDVTAEDGSSTQTYSVTVTRATPSEPITVTLAPRVEGSNTYVNIAIEWNDPQTGDGRYMVALYTSSDYFVQLLGFRTASETASIATESATDWDLSRFPDWFAGVSCHPSGLSAQTRELGRVSLRAAHPDNN